MSHLSNLQAVGKMVKSMVVDVVAINSLVMSMMESGKMRKSMALVYTHGLMDLNMKVNSDQTK